MSEHEQQLDEQGTGNEEQLVPVSEAIKYRKRAQVAEQRNESLTQELSESQNQLSVAQEKLDSVELESELAQQLMAAGTVDLEVAMLLAKPQCGSNESVAAAVEGLRQKRPGLFDIAHNAGAPATAGQQNVNPGPRVRLEQMAQKANETQNRKDMQEYLRLRRSVRGA